MYWLALSALVVGTVFDLKRREIPDSIPAILLALALLLKCVGFHPLSWGGIGLGAAVGFVATAVPFFAGVLGGGDVKLMTALGAALGFKALVLMMLLTAVFGGFLALRARRKQETEVAYAPALLAGLVCLVPFVWVAS